LAVLPLTLMFIGGLKTIQSATLVVSLPLIIVGVLMAISLVRQLQADHRPPTTVAVSDKPVSKD
jgi:BCCT family betaine/carnitine transporter